MPTSPVTKPRFFTKPAAFRTWLEKNHASAAELWVGFHKKVTGRPSMTWPESVDQALCFGWIDGIRKTIDENSYMIRFTPRRKGSVWSAVNIERAQALAEQGLMHAAGLAAFAARDEEKSRRYSYERASAELTPEQLKRFKASRKAWSFFESQPPHYRKAAVHWVLSARQEATRERRLVTLIADSEAGLRIREMRR